MKHIVLCADDYGQNFAISQAIIELCNKKRLTATSCLVTLPEWSSQAALLQPIRDQVDIGLHFNLTEGRPLSSAFIEKHGSKFLPLSKLIIQAYLPKIDKEAVAAEFEAQLDQFVAQIGRLPRFIDGHQHIHQLPVIREAIVAVWKKRLQAEQVYIRCTDTALPWKKSAGIKRSIIQVCGAKAFKRLLLANYVPHNDSFEGIYNFSGEYSAIFPKFLRWVQDNGIIMCHPGLSQVDSTDKIADARYQEYQYFMSDGFVQDCERYNVQLGRFKK